MSSDKSPVPPSATVPSSPTDKPSSIKIEDPANEPPVSANKFSLFSYGFRPFFFMGGIFGVISIGVWVAMIADKIDLNLSVAPVLWHAHEMLFGYTMAIIAGFFLTVIPNWTSAKAQKAPVLIGLTVLWVLGRVAVWSQGSLPYGLVIAVDLSFQIALIGVIVRPLIIKRHRRQFIFVPILVFLLIANVMMHMGTMGIDLWGQDWAVRGMTLAVDSVVVLLTLMGGRVTPSFTSSFLGHDDGAPKVVQNPILDRATILATLAVLIVNQAWGLSVLSGVLYLLAAGLHGVRLAGWQGIRTLGTPILWVLHLGYLWIVVGLVLRGLADFGLVDHAGSIHALTIGAIGTMTLGIMSRASLGHTGRALNPHVLTVVAYVLVSLSALARLAVPFWPAVDLVTISGGLWIGAFFIFVCIYAPILIGPRADGRPG